MHAARMLYLPLIANNTNEFISSKTSHFSLNVNLKTKKQFLTVSFALASSAGRTAARAGPEGNSTCFLKFPK